VRSNPAPLVELRRVYKRCVEVCGAWAFDIRRGSIQIMDTIRPPKLGEKVVEFSVLPVKRGVKEVVTGPPPDSPPVSSTGLVSGWPSFGSNIQDLFNHSYSPASPTQQSGWVWIQSARV